jgi:hypothetical protein
VLALENRDKKNKLLKTDRERVVDGKVDEEETDEKADPNEWVGAQSALTAST